jgi:hypothetical protein
MGQMRIISRYYDELAKHQDSFSLKNSAIPHTASVNRAASE